MDAAVLPGAGEGTNATVGRGRGPPILEENGRLRFYLELSHEAFLKFKIIHGACHWVPRRNRCKRWLRRRNARLEKTNIGGRIALIRP